MSETFPLSNPHPDIVNALPALFRQLEGHVRDLMDRRIR